MICLRVVREMIGINTNGIISEKFIECNIFGSETRGSDGSSYLLNISTHTHNNISANILIKTASANRIELAFFREESTWSKVKPF